MPLNSEKVCLSLPELFAYSALMKTNVLVIRISTLVADRESQSILLFRTMPTDVLSATEFLTAQKSQARRFR
jgi:hypothetical protein